MQHLSPENDVSDDDNETSVVEPKSLQGLKKSRRTVMLGGTSALTIPTSGTRNTILLPPLTPPLSDRTSGDVDDLLDGCYESVNLSESTSEAEDDTVWHEDMPVMPTRTEDVFSLFTL
jgi:hypothetical protein